MTQRGKAFFFSLDRVFNQLFFSTSGSVVVDPHFIPALSAQKTIDWNTIELTGDVIECFIQSRDRAHHGCATEMAETIHILPVMLDIQRILPHQILTEHLDCFTGRCQQTPCAAFADAIQSIVCVDFGIDSPVCAQNFNTADFHIITSQKLLTSFAPLVYNSFNPIGNRIYRIL